jgi:hypothetical protein
MAMPRGNSPNLTGLPAIQASVTMIMTTTKIKTLMTNDEEEEEEEWKRKKK